ncbi:MAG: divergent polysaccharide deacetylase family protein, partial [Candidatus Eisenbacteria bacterium]
YSFGPVALGFLELDRVLTVSVIPGLRHSGRVAEKAVKEGKGLLVHLPMEPIEFPRHNPGHGAVFVEQEDKVVRTLVRNGLDGLLSAVGVNNHMGSRAMQDPRVMRIILEEVGGRGLFFLDSKTIAGHTPRDLADSLGVVCLENDLFWDTGYDEKEQILEKLDRLADIARLRGTAVGIGHPRAVTLEALKEKLPEFDELGILLVPIADLVRGEIPAAPGGDPPDRPAPPAGRTAPSDSP